MSNLGSCRNCKNEWYTITTGLKPRMPVHIPTCPEAGHASVCSDCFETLTTLEIVGHAITAYRDSMLIGSADEDGVQQVHMTPTEHKMVEASIRAWVPYMKKETDERPYALEALSL